MFVPFPKGYHSITPQLTCRDAARAMGLLQGSPWRQGIMRMAGPGGRVMHAEMQIGDSRFMIGDEFPGMSVAPAPSTLHSFSLFVYTDDVDRTFNRALKAGAKADMQPSDMFWEIATASSLTLRPSVGSRDAHRGCCAGRDAATL